MRAIDGDGAGTLCGIFRSVDAPAVRFGGGQKPLRHAHGFLADGGYADFVEDLESRLTGVQRRDMRGAIQEAERIIALVDRTNLKSKRAGVRDPTGERGPQLAAEVFPNVEIGYAGAAAEPFENATYGKIHVQRSNIDGNCAGALKYVEDDVRADAMRA